MRQYAPLRLRRRYKSNTHWYIDHDAGHLKIEIYNAYPAAEKFMPNATRYWKGTTLSSQTFLDIANEEQFAQQAKTATIYYDPGDLEVRWVLPNGEIVEGMTIDVDVEAGTTLCICKDFYCTKIKVDCDICHVDLRELPDTVAGAVIPSMKQSHLADYYHEKKTFWGPARSFSRRKVFGLHNTSVVANTKDIAQRIDGSRFFRLELQNCPNVTGDLSELNIRAMPYYYRLCPFGEKRTVDSYRSFYDDTKLSMDEAGPFHVSIHHCMVHGYPRLKNHSIRYWEYYACPNASPEDYDNLIEQIVTQGDCWHYGTVDGVGFCYMGFNSYAVDDPIVEELRAAGATLMTVPSYGESDSACVLEGPHATLEPDTLDDGTINDIIIGYSVEPNTNLICPDGTLKISNRTADPEHRALRLEQLRAAGWEVEEIDDSLEEGIYATRDV